MTSLLRIVPLLLLSLVVAPSARSQNAAAAPAAPANAVFAVTYIDVAEAGIPKAIGLLHQYLDALADSGNRAVDLYQELGRADRFAIFEQWPDRAAFDAPARVAAAAQLDAALKAIETAPPDRHVLQGFDVGPLRPPGGGRAKIYGITHFVIPAARAAAFDALAKAYAAASRADAGGMRFDILREAAPRQDQITIVESWSNPQDFESYRASAPTRAFRDGVAPLLDGPYDDRFYGKFN
jgi:quinol monooxygenase YgiN